jgi:PAS domain S-box-containing protein/putative nucleotidyltransferase with HDIG domain
VPRRVALVWVTGAVAAYAVAFVLLAPVLGLTVMALLLAPAVLAGWLLGAVTGGVVAVALVALNAALGLTVDSPSVAAAAAFPGAIPGGLVALAFAVSAGALGERQLLALAARQRLQEELEASESLTAALGATEERFRLLAEEALVGVYLIQDGFFQYVNPSFAQAFGYEPQEIIERMTPDDLTDPEDRATVRAHIEARLRGDAGSAHYRFLGVRKDGGRFPVEVLGRALQVDGRPAILGTLQDHTREAEHEAELRLRLTALEAAPAGVVVTDPDGVIEWANPHALSMTGYSLADLRGTHTRVFGSGRQSREFYQALWATVTAGLVWSGDLVNRRKDGTEYYERMSITPVLGASGAIEHFVAVKQNVTERRRAEQSIRTLNATLKAQIERITALRAIDNIITRGLDMHAAITAFADVAQTSLGVDALWMHLHHEDSELLELLEVRGWREPPRPGTLMPVASTLVGQAVSEQRTVLLHDSGEIAERLPDEEPLRREGFELFGAVPMMARGKLRGGLAFAHRSPRDVNATWLGFVEALATQGAILVDNAALLNDLRTSNESLRNAYDATIEGWSRALDLRDKETEGHSRRVTELTLQLARAMGYSEDALLHVRRGALLHDIGKMGVPDSILQKPGKLTEEEWQVMRRHTTFARDLLVPIAFLERALEIPYSHHERWDGSGYPEGLEGESIPLSARIFAIADVYDALTSDRPYRKAWTREQALRHIRDGAGSHFDPSIVEVFLSLQEEPAG